ncbi:DNA-binding transcriptional MocR family regulator [Kitasatospora sp. GAS204A]|uniref:aminotransferase-like domain-containing protein n=1 Tax=unclassified Kitasatospora TaxID=2633591 RepID=UPI0024744C21|nr:PLP-dependent aminotransferase family protein [Kitasatospora sp. GAS204B]MDH6118313.1 DNA-binding transcriptional MocR family regulator [Kitasatospora sp. GAS204B]
MNESSSVDSLLTILRTEAARLTPGDQLPSSRELVNRHGVSPVTVSRAIALLAAEGAVFTRPGSGTYVAVRPSRASEPADTSWQAVALGGRSIEPAVADASSAPPAGTIMLSGGYPHESLQPTKALGAALARAARRPDAWRRAPAAGLAPLRAIFAGLPGGSVTPEDVLITGGGQGALSLLFRAIVPPGSPVLVESPSYPGALAAARAAGLRPVPVPMDQHGLRLELLADAFAMTGARLLYCQPSCHNPTGTVLAAERRQQVVDVARAAGAFLIEDDYARHLGHGRPLPRPLVADDRDGTVVYLTSLTKPASPSLRIGAVIARGPVLRRLLGMRRVDDFFIARPLQEAAVELLSTPAWDRHLRTLATDLRERCAALATGVARELPDWSLEVLPVGGLHLWLRLPPDLPEAALADTARRHGVATDPGAPFFPAESAAAHLRLGFAAAADQSELAEATRRLAGAAAELRERRGE